MISVGIDISKGHSTVCILKPFGEVLKKPFEVMHNVTELTQFIDDLLSYGEEVRVIMEATGHYHLPVLCFLQEHDIFTSLINPMLMKKYASVSLRKGKTDKMDAIKIAKFGIDHWDELMRYSVEQDVYGELKFLSRQYFQYMSLLIKEKILLSNLLDEVMPGIEQFISSSNPNFERNKLVDFAKKYWHFDTIKKMSENKFIESYEKWTKKEGYHFQPSKASDIYAHVKNSITTLPSKTPSLRCMVLEASKTILNTGKSLNMILTRMQELAKSLPEYQVVREMSGVGEKLAPRIIAEIGDIKRYHSPKALVAYAGIDAPPYQSGTFTGTNRKISKRGSRYLRKIGYEIMKSIKCVKPKTDTAVYDFILKKEAQGKAKKQAKIAGLNKFLRIYYARVSEVTTV